MSNQTGSEERELIEGWVNEGYEQVLAETGVAVDKSTMDLTAGEVDYTLPSQALRVKTIYPSDDPGRRLEPRTVNEILDLRGAEGTEDVMYYAVDGFDMLLVYGTPADDGELTVHYVPRPTAMAAGADTPTRLPSQFHPAIEAYAKWKAADWDDDTSSKVGEQYMAEYEAWLKRIRKHVNKAVGRSRPPFRLRRRGRNFPYRNGVDYGV